MIIYAVLSSELYTAQSFGTTLMIAIIEVLGAVQSLRSLSSSLMQDGKVSAPKTLYAQQLSLSNCGL